MFKVEEIKYLRVLFVSTGQLKCEIDRQIGGSISVWRSLSQSAMLKKEQSRNMNFSIYRSIFIPTLTSSL